MREQYVTSESVTEGHPDKLCDQISDGILDSALSQDPKAHVAVETMVSKNTVMIAGEISTTARLDIPAIARNVIKDVGYISEESGIDAAQCIVLTNINKQSADISRGVQKTTTDEQIGGGDQGIMYGYATNETPTYMPITIELAHSLVKRLTEVRKEGILPWLYPDGKAQVTVKYNDDDNPFSLEDIVLSAQHFPSIHYDYLKSTLMDEVIHPVLKGQFNIEHTRIQINPTGRFVIGGPAGDTGVTGRKIMVDTYGSVARHGGGAFSGKDPTKVDRSAAYMARYVAKNIVAAGLAKRCEVAIAYAIGQIQPENVNIETFGSEQVDIRIIKRIVEELFDFSVAGMIRKLDLRRPQYQKTAAYGHFGREDEGFGWEKLDMVELLRQKAVSAQYERFIRESEGV
ncbi:MAG: methionine adenosyltransferase [Eubacterium sp.]|nr:methionine adenosyltransferase [Eubacterium sp.]